MIRLRTFFLLLFTMFGCGEKHNGATNKAENQIILSSQGSQGTNVNSNGASKETIVVNEQISPVTASVQGKKIPHQSKAEMKETCCEQCDKASGKDPTGADISMKPCRAYSGVVVNNKPLLSEACMTYFHDSDLRVRDCR